MIAFIAGFATCLILWIAVDFFILRTVLRNAGRIAMAKDLISARFPLLAKFL